MFVVITVIVALLWQ